MKPLSAKTKKISYLYATLSITFWGVSFVSTKAALTEINLFSLVAIRFAIGSIFLLFLLLLLREKIAIKIRHLPHFMLLAIIGVCIHQFLQVAALQTTDATTAGWLITFSPVFTAILSIFFLHETITKQKTLGMILAILGVLVLTSKGNFNTSSFFAAFGNALMILSTLNWAIYSILLKKLKLPYSSLTITFYTSILGFFMILSPLLQKKAFSELSNISLEVWVHLFFLGIFVSGLGYLFWGKALESLDATRVSVFLYLEPLATLIAAVFILHEAILFSTILGGIMIILGVIFVNGQLDFFRRYKMNKE
ncbi:DMT family transporter [Bacillus thuringiensis]|uniref:DMT family transporter n=1 Tax=Bacillus thuringiensis TaxID=1428 RepID=UPI0021B22AC0|nr:DMT family transporter [Bacillus thuringiensis]